MDPPRLETGLLGQAAEDQERARPGERAALRVEEELRPVPAVEVGPASREVAPQGFDRLAPHGNDPFLPALSDRPDEALVEIHPRTVEPDGLADPQTRAVEELDERSVTKGARRRPDRGVDQALGFPRRERAGKAADSPWKVELGGGILRGRADQGEMAEQRAQRGDTAGDRRGREASRSKLRDPPLELLRRR